MIPRRIFYVWSVFENKKRDVLACMQSWYQTCTDYEIIEINEKSVSYFNFQEELKSNRWFKTVYDRKMWAYVADYIRVKVLYDNGGIYLDTDVSVLKNFDSFLKDSAFVGMQDNKEDGKYDLVEPAILGAQKSNNVLKYLVEFYKNDIWKLPIYSMPDLFNHTLQQLYKKNNIVSFPKREQQVVIRYSDISIYPEKVFIPFRYHENFSRECIKNETHTIHWWGSSWIKPNILYFLKNKHKKIIEKNTNISGYSKTFYLFGIVPILKIFRTENEIRIFNLLLIKINKGKNIMNSNYSLLYEIKLFNLIPIFKILSKEKGTIIKYYIFNILFIKSMSAV